MSVNRLLKRRQQQAQHTTIPTTTSQPSLTTHPLTQPHPQSPPHPVTKQQSHLQETFSQYAGYSQYNPPAHQYSNTHFPSSAALYNRFRLPLTVSVSPVSYQMDPEQKSIDKIMRCASCRGYMNYYNQIRSNSFICFMCGRENGFMGSERLAAESIQLTQPSYHVLGGQKYHNLLQLYSVYLQSPPETAFIFLIDINSSSFHSKMLYYFVAAAKQILSKQQFDQTQIHFYTYDEVLHEYDFSGDQVKCTIIDPSISMLGGSRVQDNFVGNVRVKLFELLDNLQAMAQSNKKQASGFYRSFSYVFQATKHTGGKMFVLQCNQAIVGEQFANESIKLPNNTVPQKPRSFLQTRNKTFFNRFVKQSLQCGLSYSFFIFQKKYKNIRVFGDFMKLCSSELMVYRTQSQEELTKFYYDVSYLLGCTYYKDVRMEIIASCGWILAAVYGNVHRLKQGITFKLCSTQPSKRMFISIYPQPQIELPYFCLQTITNYIYNRQHFVCVNTSVVPLTTSLERLYLGENYGMAVATLTKSALSGLRMEEINGMRNKIIRTVGGLWRCAVDYYKKNIPLELTNLILHQLGLLKSQHFQLDGINQTQALDHVISQRSILQSCSYTQLQCFFSPYLFNLSSLTSQMCRDEGEFVYPPICQLKFNQVKEGMYLMDNGLAMYLYIAKVCEPGLIRMLYGKEKLGKHDSLGEENFMTNNLFAKQVTTLIQVLREQKSWGWIPLYVIRCGQGSATEKSFYMNFYAEKYDEFRGIKFNLPEFLHVLGSVQTEQY